MAVHNKGLGATTSVLSLAAVAAIVATLSNTARSDAEYYLLPAFVAIIVFALFSILLKRQIRDNIFGDLGFIYLTLGLAYTLAPAFAFTVIGLQKGGVLAELAPPASELGAQLWRQVLFLFSVALAYLLVRGRKQFGKITIRRKPADDLTVIFAIVLTLLVLLILSVLSAPVDTYYESYTRYNHLSWFLRRLVAVCLRLNFGIYMVLLVLLFSNYRKYKSIIPIVVATICLYEVIHSLGSRINAFVILLSTAWLYQVTVKPITLKKWVTIGAALIVIFTIVEVVRPLDSDQGAGQDISLVERIRLPSELGAVFIPSFHLYEERSRGALPATKWPMFFSDFVSLVPFADSTKWDPMEWYARNYYPDALVPPFTLGPIANSAIWGGEWDLLLRGLINGAFFAYLVRWFLRRKDRWWAVTAYVFCYGFSVMTLKYSIFYILAPLIKTVIPTLVLIVAFRGLISSTRRASVTQAHKPSTYETINARAQT